MATTTTAPVELVFPQREGNFYIFRGLRISKMTAWRWEREGILPQRVPITAQSFGWPADELDAALTKLKDTRQQRAAKFSGRTPAQAKAEADLMAA